MTEIDRLRSEAAGLHRAGQLDAAERLYQQILSLDTADISARHMLGVLRLQQARAWEALVLLTAAAAESPGDADIRTHHALALHELGRHAEALADFDRALSLAPRHPATLLYRGNLLLAMNHPAEALQNYDKLTGITPHNAEAWFRRGHALWQMDRAEDAAASYGRAASLDPNHFGAQFNRATVLMRLGRFDEAFAAYEKAGQLSPTHPYLLGSAAGAILSSCDFSRWNVFRDRLIDAVNARTAVVAPLTILSFTDDPAMHRAAAEHFVNSQVPPPSEPLWTGGHYSHDRIRIAYISSDFHQHATADLMAGLFEAHDRNRFEITALSFSRDDASPMRSRLLKAFDRFIDIRDCTDAQAAALLREAEIDIAVDLKGHTENSRPGILSHRPCPVQVQYLGYPGTIGAPWLDYILADATVLPFDQKSFYSEHVVHLPYCYQVNDSKRAIGVAPSRARMGLPGDGFVFCCFNAAWKIAPGFFEIWMRLLKAVPGSVLWLLDDNDAANRNLRAAACARGVDPTRLVFAPRISSLDHLARHACADLFLDTLPYNAHTTASDALWTGLPIVTCMGRAFPGRVAASLLKAVGLPELVAHSVEEYETLALALARDPARLAAMRARLAANRNTVPLFDTGLFCRHIEAAFETMLERSRHGEVPRNYTIPA